ncbi:type I phosphodiesterase/nucleotide pyrophosphatase [Arthrobacter sp. Hiyo8]|nr:type I phosphodiesterase/nucleotide pyrophosphatase [Arthrobacter sp. Hiyo8]
MATSEPVAQDTVPVTGAIPELPGAPLYGSKSIAEVFTSAAASMGLPGFDNKLHLPASQRVCVVLADGLGRNLLKQKAAHTPFLRSIANSGQGAVPVWLDSAFPSTTASSLASLGTGRTPGEHGMVGYDVLDPAQDKVVNLLGNWDAGVDPCVGSRSRQSSNGWPLTPTSSP